jgi:hypothetical protein
VRRFCFTVARYTVCRSLVVHGKDRPVLTSVRFVDQSINCMTRHPSTRGKGWDRVAVALVMVVVSKNNILKKKKNVNFN